MLVGAKYGVTVGAVEADHREEVSALMSELLAAGSAALGVPEAPGAVERLLAYARSVAHFPTAVKEVGAAPCGLARLPSGLAWFPSGRTGAETCWACWARGPDPSPLPPSPRPPV
jgi:hypothetical protein